MQKNSENTNNDGLSEKFEKWILKNQGLFSMSNYNLPPKVTFRNNCPLLIAPLSNDICGHMFKFLSKRECTSLLLVCKTWRNDMLSHPSFYHLWKRIVIGGDPLRNSFGHSMKITWLDQSFDKIKDIVEILIYATGIVEGEIYVSENEARFLFCNQFLRLHTVIFYSSRIKFPQVVLRYLKFNFFFF